MKQYNQELQEYRHAYEQVLREKGFARTRVCGVGDEDYEEIFTYITENRPKLIVEYGSGESTYMINKLLDELGYGGKIVSFEDNEYWYSAIKEGGLDPWNSVRLVSTVEVDAPLPGGKIFAGCRYEHSYEGLEEVDYCIIDGPDLRNSKFTKTLDTTINLLEMWQQFDKFIPYFIDSRSGTKFYYSEYESYLF